MESIEDTILSIKPHTPGQAILTMVVKHIKGKKAKNNLKAVDQLTDGSDTMNINKQAQQNDQTRHIRSGARIGAGVGAGMGAVAGAAPVAMASSLLELPKKIAIPATALSALLFGTGGGASGAAVGAGLGALKKANTKQALSATPIADAAGKLLKVITPAVETVKGVSNQAGNIAKDVGGAAVNASKELGGYSKGILPGIKRVGAEAGKAIEKHPYYASGAAGAVGVGAGATGANALDRHVTPTNKPVAKSKKINKKAGYDQGFMDKCTAMGVDANELVKQSQAVAKPLWEATKRMGTSLLGGAKRLNPARIGEQSVRKLNDGTKLDRAALEELSNSFSGLREAGRNVINKYPKSSLLAAGGTGVGAGGLMFGGNDKHAQEAKITQEKVTKGIGEAKDWMKRKGKATLAAGSKAFDEVKKAEISNAYTHGFISKCTAMGIDAEALIKGGAITPVVAPAASVTGNVAKPAMPSPMMPNKAPAASVAPKAAPMVR